MDLDLDDDDDESSQDDDDEDHSIDDQQQKQRKSQPEQQESEWECFEEETLLVTLDLGPDGPKILANSADYSITVSIRLFLT